MAGGPNKPVKTRRSRLVRITSDGGEVPRRIRRIQHGIGISLAVAFVFVIGFAILQLLDIVPDDGHALLYGFFVLVLAASIFWDLSCKRALRRAAAHDYLLCPDCTYELGNLRETGHCPECGRAYEHAAVRAQWIDAERRLKRT